MPSFRFIHTGDIHLDSPLKGLAGQQGAAAERIRTATRTAFENLISHAIDDAVDFVVIAGDLYDGDWRDYQTGLFFVQQMGRLSQAKIPVYLIYGNHDAESLITRKLTLPSNVSVFSARKAETFRLKHLDVAFHGQSFRQRDITDNLVPAYPPPIAGCFNIGVLHTALGGMPGHANYAPCAIEDLVNKGYGYWALAHVHQAAVLHERPHVVFCGNLQGRHIRETGAKGASLVTVEDGQVTEITPLHVDCVRWIHLPVAVEQCRAVVDVVDRIRQAIEEGVERDAQGRLLACRIELTGRTGLHAELLASADHLLPRQRPRLWAWAKRRRGSSVFRLRPRAIPGLCARTRWVILSASSRALAAMPSCRRGLQRTWAISSANCPTTSARTRKTPRSERPSRATS